MFVCKCPVNCKPLIMFYLCKGKTNANFQIDRHKLKKSLKF